MKKISFILLLLMLQYTVTKAQNTNAKADDAARIVLNTFVPEQIEGLTPAVKNNLENKLSQIATKAGMGGAAADPRFIITANVVVLTKDITPTAPPMHAYTLEVTLYIADGIEGNKFSTTGITLKGVGETETKAYMAALKGLKIEDPKYAAFIEGGKNKIIEYYNAKCDFILKEAKMLADQNNFDAAINKLVSVPDVCKECYDKAMDAVQPIFQKRIDLKCTELLSKAQGIWSASQDEAGAKEAVTVLQEVHPQSKCFKETTSMVDFLFNEIKKRVKELDDREWKLKLKEQQDNVNIQKATIKAARDIGVAYGKNQPRNNYNVSFIYR